MSARNNKVFIVRGEPLGRSLEFPMQFARSISRIYANSNDGGSADELPAPEQAEFDNARPYPVPSCADARESVG